MHLREVGPNHWCSSETLLVTFVLLGALFCIGMLGFLLVTDTLAGVVLLGIIGGPLALGATIHAIMSKGATRDGY